MRKNTAEVNLIDLFYYLLKRVWIIVLVALIFAVVSLGYSKFIVVPQFTASARVYVLNRSSENSLAYSDLQSSDKLTSDFEVLITGRNVTSEVIGNLNLTISHSELVKKVSVSSPNDTRVLQISVKDEDPELAASITNEILKVAGDQIVPIMGIDALNVVYEAVVPMEPSSPNIKQNVLLAAALGFLLALVILVLHFVLDDTLRTEEDVTKYLQMSVMGVIPKDTKLAEESNHRKFTDTRKRK